MDAKHSAGIAGVHEAARRLQGVAEATPLRRSEALSRITSAEIWLKLENRQATGSFKLRGALNALAGMSEAERAGGVVTASAGNHGAGLAHAARLTGVPATIFVPAGAPMAKRERILSTGADLRLVNGGYDRAHETALAFAEAGGGVYVHAFSDAAVVEGQGTVGLEILEKLPGVETILVPVGGGGLIGGIGVVARAARPSAWIIGVQTPATSAMYHSLARGEVVPAPASDTLCDGLEGDIDEASLTLARRVVDRMMLVEEDEVARAVTWMLREEGERVEPSGAVAVAALLGKHVTDLRSPVAVVVSGGNVDEPLLKRLLAHHDGNGGGDVGGSGVGGTAASPDLEAF